MKNIFRLFCVVSVLLLAVALLAACGDAKTDDSKGGNETGDKTAHTHIAGDEWFADKDGHWKVCTEDGEQVLKGAHTLKNFVCEECKVEVRETSGGEVSVIFYNGEKSWVKRLNYDKDGNIVEQTAQNVYDDKGNIMSKKVYEGEDLVVETENKNDEDGNNYEAKITVYNVDGTKVVSEYNKNGDPIVEATYNADGVVESSVQTEYEDGIEKGKKYYEGDKLVKEEEKFIFSQDSWGGKIYYIRVTEYKEDGTKTVNVYNENYELVEGAE